MYKCYQTIPATRKRGVRWKMANNEELFEYKKMQKKDLIKIILAYQSEIKMWQKKFNYLKRYKMFKEVNND